MNQGQGKEEAPQNPEPEVTPQLNSFGSLRSMESVNQQNKEEPEKPQQEEGVELHVVQSKVDKGINHEEIMKMFNEQLQKEEKERQEIEKRRMEMRLRSKQSAKPAPKRPAPEQKKINSKGQTLQQVLNQKSGRIRKMIEPHCKKYRVMFRPSVYDTKMNRYRFECKQKLFIHLCFGLQELRSFSPQELSEIERELLAQDPYSVIKKQATLIDAALIKILNKGDRNEIGREYKKHWETLLANLKDESNLELKRKILSRTMEPTKIALASQIDFFTQAKRDQLLEKQKQYVAEFTVEKAMQKHIEEPIEEALGRPKVEEEERSDMEPVLKPQRSTLANKYIEESSIVQIQELLSPAQLSKMLNRLQIDIQGRCQSLLIKNFKEVFDM